jgi:hypothetical protein
MLVVAGVEDQMVEVDAGAVEDAADVVAGAVEERVDLKQPDWGVVGRAVGLSENDERLVIVVEEADGAGVGGDESFEDCRGVEEEAVAAHAGVAGRGEGAGWLGDD